MKNCTQNTFNKKNYFLTFLSLNYFEVPVAIFCHKKATFRIRIKI